jgi:lipoprotein-anchoring transpeptidase ErfK/SrfK
MSSSHITISIQAQRLHVYTLPAQEAVDRWDPDAIRRLTPCLSVDISSSRNGIGQDQGSFRTPIGRHYIRAKIGQGAALHTVFVGRRPTGEIWSPELAQAQPERDWILTRILWLCGLERGVNRLGRVDTMRRYIYLHGSPASVDMGEPGSIGCIRMRGLDIIDLFDLVPAGTTVDIHP